MVKRIPREKRFEELSPLAKRGLTKFASFSVAKMRRVTARFRKETGRNPNDVTQKERVFRFIARKKFR